MFNRPMPPSDYLNAALMGDGPYFMPAPDVWDWIELNILSKDGKIYNADHEHLQGQTEIVIMWAGAPFLKQERYVLGQCESVAFRAGGWQKIRMEQQMVEWFGFVPKFIITLAAEFCNSCSDAEFCALVEHELYHMKHAENLYGLMYDKETGLPKLKMRGHDVEEFHGVVRRYGGDVSVKKMAELANQRPEVALADIAHSCGTCLLRVV